MTVGAWELDVYPEAPKVLSFCFMPTLCWSRSNSVYFRIFSLTALLAIGSEGSKRLVEEMVLR